MFVHWDYCSGMYSSFGTLETVLCWPHVSRHFCFSDFVQLALPVDLPLLWNFIFAIHLHSYTKLPSLALCLLFLFFTLFIVNSLCVSLSFVNLHCLLTVSGGLSAQHNFNLEDFVSSPRAPNNPANKIFLLLSVRCLLHCRVS